MILLATITVAAVVLLLVANHFPAGKPDWKVFLDSRNCRSVYRLLEWDGQVVFQIVGFYTLDPSTATASPLRLPGAEKIWDLASQGPGRPLALCEEKGGLFLLGRRDGNWSRRELPQSMRLSTEQPVLLAADSRVAVVIGTKGLARFESGSGPAELVQWPSPPDFLVKRFPKHRLLVDGDLYLGEEAGEFGGGLNRIDIRTGASERIFGGWPVNSLAIGLDGSVWESEGLAHLTIRKGRIHVNSKGDWTEFCVSGSSTGRDTNWDLPPTSFGALAIDSIGRPTVLSEELGLVRYESGKWSRLTPDWPGFVYVTSLLLTSDDQAIVGTYDAGVMLLDLRSGKVRRVVPR
jgi:hypothetical protein